MNKLRALFSSSNSPSLLPKDYPESERQDHRVVNLRKTYNFRDLGGYVGENGRKIKWGKLYRADNLHRLSSISYTTFHQLHLTTLIDFRSTYEKKVEPNRLPPNHTINIVELPILDRASKTMGKSLQERIRNGDVADLDGNALMLDANRQFVAEYTAEYRQFIQHIIAAEGKPVLFHCTGGKDRTGFAAAILLKLLGVSQKQIMQDYLLSNALILPALKRRLQLYALIRGAKALKVVEELARVTPDYLGTAFQTIDATYGSFDNYVKTGLNLTNADIELLKKHLLE